MSTTTAAFASASAKPSPVIVLTPVFGAAAIASCPFRLSFSTTFDPIKPVPPITTIFMTSPLAVGFVRGALYRFKAPFVLWRAAKNGVPSYRYRAAGTVQQETCANDASPSGSLTISWGRPQGRFHACLRVSLDRGADA